VSTDTDAHPQAPEKIIVHDGRVTRVLIKDVGWLFYEGQNPKVVSGQYRLDRREEDDSP